MKGVLILLLRLSAITDSPHHLISQGLPLNHLNSSSSAVHLPISIARGNPSLQKSKRSSLCFYSYSYYQRVPIPHRKNMRQFISVSVFLVVIGAPIVLGMNKMPPPDVKSYPGFGRQCSSDTDCVFDPKTPPEGGGSIYLKCKPATDGNGAYCACGSGSIPDKELMWPLEWDTMSQKCFVGKGASCGEHNGLQTNCKAPFECLEGRCRNSSEIHSALENKFCQDDLDCKEGLKCLASRVQTMVNTRRCYSA